MFFQVDGPKTQDGISVVLVFSVRIFIILIEALDGHAIYVLEWLEVFFLGDDRIDVPVPGDVLATELLEDFQV